VIRRTVRIVASTHKFKTFPELAERSLGAPVTVIKAAGDDYLSIEAGSGWSAKSST
jgi:hypothetical protein